MSQCNVYICFPIVQAVFRILHRMAICLSGKVWPYILIVTLLKLIYVVKVEEYTFVPDLHAGCMV